ncbi:isocitrate/isopropylmalate family dehydrogenase [Geodermatophilus maliterrae]|uniref:Isocitrate/isopropylmalate family dehydrogenase n=1 Tax=Geodermatophilus maliterrae TaxID=3162531 RepID=A0ABV3X9Z5_9ACTN
MTRYRIALIPGDGIGAEVLPPAEALLDAVGRRHGIEFAYDSCDWSCERYLAEGAMVPDDGLDRIRHHDAVLLGAVGWPGVPDHVSPWGLLIPIRRTFQQYVNLRPVKALAGVPSPLRSAGAGGVDLVVVRGNVEGEYSEIGGRLGRGTADELAVQEAVITRKGVTRVVEYAYAVAGSIGVAPAADLDPEREFPSMFEPVHGSAPDIAGRGEADPLGAIWSAAMMLDHLGHPDASAELLAAAFGALADGVSAADLGGTADTAGYTRAVPTGWAPRPAWAHERRSRTFGHWSPPPTGAAAGVRPGRHG